MTLAVEQTLNGLQLGIMLFLIAAGITLVFGIMNLINVAQGSFYMIGAYVCAWCFTATGSLLIAFGAALGATILVAVIVEFGVFRALYHRDHLDQMLASFGLTMGFNEAVRIIWGPSALYAPVPRLLSGSVMLLPGLPYPTYRLAVIGAGLLVALSLFLLVNHTKLGMLIRAGASNRTMVAAMGVNISLLFTLVFCIGAALAGFAGLLAGPLYTVESGMGDGPLILAFVIIVIGGVGSIGGSFVASLLVGLIDTMGRAFLRPTLALVFSRSAADRAGPALASMLIFIFMAILLYYRPRGLFPEQTR